MTIRDLRINILVTDRGCAGLVEELGFAVWLDAGGQTILFDTGQGAALAANAAALGCDLPPRALALSHGHYDHSGAVSQALQHAPSARVCCHPGAFVPRYSVKPDEAPRTIAVAESDREALLALTPGQLRWIEKPQLLAPGIGISGPIPRTHPLEDTGGPFFLDLAGSRPDPLDDDQALWIETGERADHRHRLLPRRADQHRRASPYRYRHRQDLRDHWRTAPAECVGRAPGGDLRGP